MKKKFTVEPTRRQLITSTLALSALGATACLRGARGSTTTTSSGGVMAADDPGQLDERITPARDIMLRHLRQANGIAKRAVEAGHHPFGALLVAEDGETVLLEQGNLSTVAHAESELARAAFASFPKERLWRCALYTTVEPCAMCAGTQYWANIGTLVYGISERMLLDMTGNHEENPTMDLPSRTVFQHGQKDIRVQGPFPEVAEEIAAVHRDFWS